MFCAGGNHGDHLNAIPCPSQLQGVGSHRHLRQVPRRAGGIDGQRCFGRREAFHAAEDWGALRQTADLNANGAVGPAAVAGERGLGEVDLLVVDEVLQPNCVARVPRRVPYVMRGCMHKQYRHLSVHATVASQKRG